MPIQGLSDQAQAILVFISALLIALSGVSVATFPDPYKTPMTLIFAIAGALGFAIKEALGLISSTPSPTPTPAKSS